MAVLTCCACGSNGEEGDNRAKPTTSPPASSTTAPAEPTVTEEAGEEAPPADETEAIQIFPGRNVRISDEGIIANRSAWGADWPWKTANVTMACSEAINGGAYLNAADGKNYLLNGTISQQGFVEGNAGTDLWDQRDTDVFAEWMEAAEALCPPGA